AHRSSAPAPLNHRAARFAYRRAALPPWREPFAHERCRSIGPMLRICLIATCGLLAPSALAKDFGPGDLRVCGRYHCVPITNRHLLGIMSRYYYGPGRVSRAERVRLGALGFELRYKNGYASGIVATAKLARF